MQKFSTTDEIEKFLIEFITDSGLIAGKYDLDTIARLVTEHQDGHFAISMDDEELAAYIESTPFLEFTEETVAGDHDGEIVTIVRGYQGWEVDRKVTTVESP